MKNNIAFGSPGIVPKWTSSAKNGVGTALNNDSEVWFTISHGILNEIFFPRVDIACVRDMGFLVADGDSFFSEEKRNTKSQSAYEQEGIPAFNIINTCLEGNYRLSKQIIADPKRNCILQKVKVEVLKNKLNDYKLYALLAPHINNGGWGNNAWVQNQVLYANKGDVTLAMIASVPFSNTSVGFVGQSDSWQDISAHKKMLWNFDYAENGNVALCGEININRINEFELVISFADSAENALKLANESLSDGFDMLKKIYIEQWKNHQNLSFLPKLPLNTTSKLWKTSISTILSHEAIQYKGGYIASLSIPWGFSKSDNDTGGYHLIWPRDLVETAGGLLAANLNSKALEVLLFLKNTQLEDGHWLQNMWLDGSPYWGGIQLDETAFPILLLGLLYEKKVIDAKDLYIYKDMLWRATDYLVKNGPNSPQDRWEENAGYSPFTLAVEISALLVSADLMEIMEATEPYLKNNVEKETSSKELDCQTPSQYLRTLADCWNESIERWCYVQKTELAKEVGVDGYFVRIAPSNVNDNENLNDDLISIKNLSFFAQTAAKNIVSPDALALVRFGLRAATAPHILNTIKVIDAKLKIKTPNGDCWYRYNEDGYGEHEDGSPFNGTGKGRLWPLMTGERAHYEIANGNYERAAELLNHLNAFANEGDLLPEQIWDTEDIPERELFFGQPSGSAMPLVWAHSEYLKLCRSLQDKSVFDMPSVTQKRYLKDKTTATHAIWRFSDKIKKVAKNKIVRIEADQPFILHWSSDSWETINDTTSKASVFGLYYVDIPTISLKVVSKISFTFLWQNRDRWENKDYEIIIVDV